MLQVTRKNDLKEIGPSIVNSEAEGAHTSIFLPIVEGDSESTLRERLNYCLAQAANLLSISMTKREIQAYLKPFQENFDPDDVEGGVRGFAFFKSRSVFFHSFLRVPPPELVVVASSFHIKPLMYCASSTTVCYALTVSSRKVKLFRIIGSEIVHLRSYKNDFHQGEGKDEARYNGKPRKAKDINELFIRDTVKRIMKEYNVRVMDLAVLGVLGLRRRLIAELSAKAKVNIFYESTMFTSMESMGVSLEANMKDSLEKKSQNFAKNLMETADEGLLAKSLDRIAEAAVQGRIECLVIDPTVHIWGLFDRENGLVRTYSSQSSDKDGCVVDDIAEEVIKRGGEVVFFNSSLIENVAPYLATLRW